MLNSLLYCMVVLTTNNGGIQLRSNYAVKGVVVGVTTTEYRIDASKDYMAKQKSTVTDMKKPLTINKNDCTTIN